MNNDRTFIIEPINCEEQSSILEPLLTAKQVQRVLNVSLPMVYKLAHSGQIPCIKWGCPAEGKSRSKLTIRFRKSDIIKFIGGHYAE